MQWVQRGHEAEHVYSTWGYNAGCQRIDTSDLSRESSFTFIYFLKTCSMSEFVSRI